MTEIARTFIVCICISALMLFGYWKLSDGERRKAMEELRIQNEEMEQRLEQRQAMIDRLGTTRRMAHVSIDDQELADDGTVLTTDLTFIELDEQGSELGRQSVTVPGDMVYFDAWTVKFGHEDVAAGHPLLGRTLILFKRIYSEQLAPADGFEIDTPGAVPPGYAAHDLGRFEQHLWEHFWEVAGNAELAIAMGVRVAQGEVVYKRVATGQRYMLEVDNVGGMNLSPITGEIDPENHLLINPRSGSISVTDATSKG